MPNTLVLEVSDFENCLGGGQFKKQKYSNINRPGDHSHFFDRSDKFLKHLKLGPRLKIPNGGPDTPFF